MKKSYFIIAIAVILQLVIFIMLIVKASATYINTLVSISLLLILYIRVNYIVWSVRLDDFFKYRNNLDIQRKEAIMFLFLPTFLSFTFINNNDGEVSMHTVMNFSTLAIIATIEFFRRIKY